MCTTCGCGSDEIHVEGRKIAASGHWHRHEDGSWHHHEHLAAGHGHEHPGPGRGPRYVPPIFSTFRPQPPTPASRVIEVEQALLAKNDAIAQENRRLFADRAVFALNLVSSPGAGKTSLLVRTIEAWRDRTPVAVIEGDQQTSRDADRVRAAGARAVQINTGKGCHLDAQMVASALEELSPAEASLLLIENVGNLVCPAAFDLGEAHKVAILSVTEGEDKPLKYPDMFHAADLLVLSKIDLLPHVDFDLAAALEYARRVRPDVEVIQLSTKTGEGFDDWLAWLDRGIAQASALNG
jgi:hydrogenase nickel incorporation protein HypB